MIAAAMPKEPGLQAGLIGKAKSVVRALRIFRAVVRHPLHRGRRIRATTQWLRVELASHLAPTHQITVPYIDDTMLNWPRASTSVMICARYGLGEPEDMAFCLHLLRPEDLFCDVGANAGVYTVLAAGAVGCSVVAMEPVPQTFNLLMQNIYVNDASERVDARRVGVGSKPGRLYFTSSLWSYNHVTDAPAQNTVDVDVLPLDDILAHRVPLAIKIDVEGFEAEVIAGASRSLASPLLKAVLIEMADEHVARYGRKLEEIVAALLSTGLSGPYWYEPDNRSLVKAGVRYGRRVNQIFVRDKDFVIGRLKGAKHYKVHDAQV